MMDGLADLGFSFGEPQGAFFCLHQCRLERIAAFELTYLLLHEGHVLIFPGTAFGEKWVDWLRISYLQTEEQLKEALVRMGAVLARVKEESGE